MVTGILFAYQDHWTINTSKIHVLFDERVKEGDRRMIYYDRDPILLWLICRHEKKILNSCGTYVIINCGSKRKCKWQKVK
jgi:hypothetical protein